AGDEASSRLKSSLSSAESVFARLRNEANSELSKIPRDAAGGHRQDVGGVQLAVAGDEAGGPGCGAGGVQRAAVGGARQFRRSRRQGSENATRRALTFADVFEVDLPRATQIAGQSVKNGLAKNATEAFEPADGRLAEGRPLAREDVLDAADEYGGSSASSATTASRRSACSHAGPTRACRHRQAGDAVKEFGILITTDLARTKPVIDGLGLNYERLADDLLAGGGRARRGTSQIIDGLLSIKSPSQQARDAVALFGTPLEDLGVDQIPSFLRSLKAGGDELDNFRGATDRAGDAAYDNAQSQLKAFGRGIQQDVTRKIVDALRRSARPPTSSPTPSAFAEGRCRPRGGSSARFREPAAADQAGRGCRGADGLHGAACGRFDRRTGHPSGCRTHASQGLRQDHVGRGADGACCSGGRRHRGSRRKRQDVQQGAGRPGIGWWRSAAGVLVGGPIGGAIGGGAGALLGLWNATKKSSEAMRQAKPPAKNYADTLDQLTGATTRQTRAEVLRQLQQADLLGVTKQLGVNTRECHRRGPRREGRDRIGSTGRTRVVATSSRALRGTA
ncbi:hypothetical protein U1Q18_052340, partial [Sarracenia purpurea var. burkii]